jgi:arylsulfatase A-like enzyme
VSVLERDAGVERDCLWWLHEGNRAIRAGDWKLTAAKGDDWQLYNLAADRGEQQDLSAANPEKRRELELAKKSGRIYGVGEADEKVEADRNPCDFLRVLYAA